MMYLWPRGADSAFGWESRLLMGHMASWGDGSVIVSLSEDESLYCDRFAICFGHWGCTEVDRGKAKNFLPDVQRTLRGWKAHKSKALSKEQWISTRWMASLLGCMVTHGIPTPPICIEAALLLTWHVTWHYITNEAHLGFMILQVFGFMAGCMLVCCGGCSMRAAELLLGPASSSRTVHCSFIVLIRSTALWNIQVHHLWDFILELCATLGAAG